MQTSRKGIGVMTQKKIKCTSLEMLVFTKNISYFSHEYFPQGERMCEGNLHEKNNGLCEIVDGLDGN